MPIHNLTNMKNTLFSLFLFISLFGSTQNWCAPGANWKYNFFSAFYGEGYTEINYSGDTTINGQLSQVLTKHHHIYNFMTDQYESNFLGKDYTFESNEVVYIWFENNWDTLYNFNALIGDSWSKAKMPSFTNCDSNSVLTVTATGVKTINSIPLKYVVVADLTSPFFFTDTIVEKIGFLGSYMIPTDNCVIDGNEGGPFRCYSDNNFTTFKPYFEGTCDHILGTEEIIPQSNFQLITDNEANQLKIIGELKTESELTIINSSGQQWKVESEQGLIDISTISQGIYFLRILQEGRVYSERFIVK